MIFKAIPLRANFFKAVAFSKEYVTNLSREQKNPAVFANRINWRKITITTLTKATAVNEHITKEKIVECYKICMQARNRSETFRQT